MRLPKDLRAAIDMLRALQETPELTPNQDHAAWKVIGDCANTLKKDNLADKCKEILLSHEYTMLDYENKSLVTNDYSITTTRQRNNCAPPAITERGRSSSSV